MSPKRVLSALLAVLIAVPVIAWQAPRASALSPLDVSYNFAGALDSASLDADGANLILRGSVKASVASDATALSAYVVEIYESETLLDFSARTPFYTTSTVPSNVNLTIPLSSLRDKDSRFGEVFTAKVALVVTRSDGSRQLVDFAKYLSNPEVLAANKNPQPATKSIKGVGTLMPSDLEHLGVQYTSINVLLWDMLTITNHGSSSIPFEFEGETYYFKRDYIENLDNTLLNCYKNNISIFGIFIMKNANNNDPDSPAKFYANPDSTSTVDLVGVNMKDARGIQYYKAIIHFIAQRYSRTDGKYGRFDGYVVGNEIGASTAWNNMGDKSLNDYVDEYTRWLRLTNTIVKSYYADGRVYASFDHNWTVKEKQNGFVSYSNRDLIDAITNISRLQGDFGWNIAWHPYPQDIYKIDMWNDPDCTNSFDTKYISFKNLQVLPAYMRQPDKLYNGRQRHIALTEQGFTSTDNSEYHQRLQAAAYAYAYYKVLSVAGIDFFSMNGQIDNTLEMDLSLGLWAAKDGTVNTPDYPKAIYNVFQNIDTVNSLAVTTPLLDIVGETLGRKVTSWKDVIPEFDEAYIRSVCNRPALTTGASGTLENPSGTVTISSGTLANWQATDDTQDLALRTDAQRGVSVPAVSLTTKMYSNFALNYRGMTYNVPQAQRNFSAAPIVSVDCRLDGVDSTKLEFVMRAYSGDKVIEGTPMLGTRGEWNTVSLDLTGFSGIASIARIKVWVRSAEGEIFNETASDPDDGVISVDNLRRSASGTLYNLAVTADKTQISNAGETINITLSNYGNKTISGKAEFKAENGIQVDTAGKDITLHAVEKVTIPLKITSLKLENFKSGKITVTFDGKSFPMSLTKILTPDFVVGDGGKVFLGQFEDGLNDGWTVDDERTTITARSMTHGVAGGRFPTNASAGSYFMQAERNGSLNALTPGYIVKKFRQPRDFSHYDTFVVDVFGHGGPFSEAYMTLMLTTTDGEVMTFNQVFVPNNLSDSAEHTDWATLTYDISNFAKRNKIASVSIGYSAKDWNTTPVPTWGSAFAIDNFYVLPDATGGVAGGPPVVAGYENVDLGQPGGSLSGEDDQDAGSQPSSSTPAENNGQTAGGGTTTGQPGAATGETVAVVLLLALYASAGIAGVTIWLRRRARPVTAAEKTPVQ